MTGYICDNCGSTRALEYSITDSTDRHVVSPSGWYRVDRSPSIWAALFCTRECLLSWLAEVKAQEEAE